MTEVERVRVGDVLSLERRPVQLDPTFEYVAIGLRSFGRGLFHYEPRPGEDLGSLRFFELRAGRLVISNIKGWEGAVAVSSDADSGCVASNRFLKYISQDGRIDVGWARWFFLSEAGNALLQRASPGSADRNRTLAVKRFEDLVIPLPPIARQQAIAQLLERLRARSEKLMQLLTQASTLSAALRTSLALTETGRGESRRVSLADVLELDCHRIEVEPTGAYNLAGVYSFGRGMFERASIDGSQTSYRMLHRLQAGQLVMSRLKAWEGAIAVVEDSFHGLFLSPEFPTFTVDLETVEPRFLHAIVTSESFWRKLGGTSKGIGARRERVHADRLLDQTLSLPTIEVQRCLLARIARVEAAEAGRRASEARIASLLPSALNREFGSLA